jgi:hypothetical protein
VTTEQVIEIIKEELEKLPEDHTFGQLSFARHLIEKGLVVGYKAKSIKYIIGKNFGNVFGREKGGVKKNRPNKVVVLEADEKRIIEQYRARKSEFEKQCEDQGIRKEDVHSYWAKSKEFSIYVRMPDVQEEDLMTRFENLVKKHKKSYKSFKPKIIKDHRACKVTTSDDHIGLDPNPRGTGLFQYEYGPEAYKSSMDKVFNAVMKEHNTYGTFDVLFIDNLGDQQDGFNGFTTRGGHELPQNMSNGEVYDVCVDTKVRMIRSLVDEQIANKIVLRSVSNDNHSGDFGLIINKSIQKIINLIYDESVVEIDILERFIEHRVYGDHCWLLTHGKDKREMKRGMPLHLDPKTINFITDYIDHYGVDSRFIHVEKGDLHQIGYQKCKRFDYRNFMSFAPPSNWVQHNFGDSYSGFSVQIVNKHSNDVCHTDYFLDYSKSR